MYCNFNTKLICNLFLIVFLLFTAFSVSFILQRQIIFGQQCASGVLSGIACDDSGGVPIDRSSENPNMSTQSIPNNNPPVKSSLNSPCINVKLPDAIGGNSDICLNINEVTSIPNSIHPTVILKPLSGGLCSFGEYRVKDNNGQTYCLQSDK